jgi:hypothetical protein
MLETAGTSLMRLGLLDRDPSDVEWSVLGRIDRRGSTLFHLETGAGRESRVGVYYKVLIPPPFEPDHLEGWLRTTKAGLERSTRLEKRLADLTSDDGLVFSRALATDPDTLTSVVLEVEGEPFGKPWRHLLGRRRKVAAMWLSRVGRVARLIEQCSDDEDEVVIGDEERAAAIDRRLTRVRSTFTSAQMARLETRMIELDRLSMSVPRPAAYVHGDLSSTNILIGDHLGLIDFTWPAMVRGFDVAHLAFRLEYDTAAPPRLTKHLTDALLDGYGVPDLGSQPSWRLHRFVRLLKFVQGFDPPGRGRVRRAFTEIESL